MDSQGFHSPHPTSSSSSCFIANLHTLGVSSGEWKIAEKRVDEILSMVQPTVVSDRLRKEIIEYIQMVCESTYGIKVFPFGSVPLKTYLPDGDIDLTAICYHDEDVLLSIIYSLLQNRRNSGMEVRDVQFIPAQVKVVKCSVEKIAVDISFNQISGLCALSFLEQVDQLVGENHLFKRSVILIKAWCFYESRILGAYYGLISTYALETMVIHIVNLFHSSLHCPLAVLYKFLQHYSTFDWEKYCVAVNGLVLISSLPEVVVQPPDDSDDLILTNEFLQSYREAYSLSTGTYQSGNHSFQTKFFNIMDPLRGDNNLGRSVGKANFNRIKCAFSYGYRNLHNSLILPRENMSKGIERFFKTTIARIGKGKHPDVVLQPEPGDGICGTLDENENLLADIQYGLWYHANGMHQGHSDPMSPQIQSNVSLNHDGYHDQNATVEVKGGLASSVDLQHSQNVTEDTTGEKMKSRETGTYIPQPLSGPKEGGNGNRDDSGNSCVNRSSANTSLTEFPPLPPPMKALESIIQEKPSLSSHKAAKEVVALSESVETLIFPPIKDLSSVNTPVPAKADESRQIHQSPEKDQEEVEAAKPLMLANANEFPALPGKSSGIARELPPSSPWKLAEKATDGSEGRSWKEALVREQPQKGTDRSKRKEKGDCKEPWVSKPAQKDGKKDESKAAAKKPLVGKPAKKSTYANGDGRKGGFKKK